MLCEETKNPQICHAINDKLGLLYNELGKYDKANSFLLAAKDFAYIRKDDRDLANSFVNLGYLELKERTSKNQLNTLRSMNVFLKLPRVA